MKIPIIVSVILIFVIFLLFINDSVSFNNLNSSKSKILQNVNSPTPIIKIYSTIGTTTGTYAYLMEKVKTVNQIIFINNTQTELTTNDLMAKYGCHFGINGGFYTTDDQPLGWMVIDGIQISKPKDSLLLDGNISITGNNIFIGKQYNEKVKYGLQTGPILIKNGKSLHLSMNKDKPSRRMVMGVTADNEVVVLSVFDPTAELSGPELTSLAEIVLEIGKYENVNIIDAINLDGGTASAIYTSKGNLQELNNVGSWWCIR